MKFVSLGPRYYSLIGHGMPYQTCLHEMCQSLKLSYVLLLPKNSPYANLGFDFQYYFSKNLIRRLFDYIKIFTQKTEKSIYFIETFKAIDWVFLTISALFLNKSDRLLILFRKGLKQNFWHRSATSFLLKYLSLKKQVKFLTDSELIAFQFYQTFGFKIDVLPIPHTQPFSAKVSISDKIICFWPGEPRPSKGLAEMQSLCEIVDPKKFQLIAAGSSKLKNTHLIKDGLSREEYDGYMKKCDIVLLPYDPLVYQYGTSGIFVETICLGKFPLVKEGSWLAYELRKHGLPELIVDWHNPQFFTELSKLYSSSKIQEKLFLMRTEYLRFHSQEKFNAYFAAQLTT